MKEYYSNSLIVSKDNLPLARCNRKKALWYVKKNLATLISNDPITIKLKFDINKDVKIDKFSLALKKDICHVCGVDSIESNLTFHHIIPKCYKKHLNIDIKNHTPHDVILLCEDCHSSYEKKASLLKEKLLNELSVKNNLKLFKLAKVKGGISSLINYNKYLSSDKKDRILSILEENFSKKLSTKELEDLLDIKTEYINIADLKPFNQYEFIINNYGDLQNFHELWRQHFLTEMKPKFMPKEWDLKRKIYEN